MRRNSTGTILLCLLGHAALVAALSTLAHASGEVIASTPGKDAWMPDVGERVTELRERTQLAAAQARERDRRESQRGQWWRAVAARPARTVSR